MSSGLTCLVDECEADLTDCRKYYQRHKVCEIHSKSPQVSINGQNLRFCQQCSRFHSLEEFDEGKRSCRKRLDGHNKRRRKPRQHLFPPNHGSDMLQFGGEQVHPTMNPVWSEVGEGPASVDHSNYAPSLLSSSVEPPVQASSSTPNHVVHPAGSLLDQGPSYGGLENYRGADWGGMADMDPQTLPFYWQS